jgi:NADH:ubiquinone reductase (H+-translocating)
MEAYDYLILAAGARHSYFGHDEWEAFAPGRKSLEDAIELGRRTLYAFRRDRVQKAGYALTPAPETVLAIP